MCRLVGLNDVTCSSLSTTSDELAILSEEEEDEA